MIICHIMNPNPARNQSFRAGFPVCPLFQRFPDGGGAGDLAVAVEVAVDVGSRVHIAVSEPILYLLHRSSEREQERSAGMPQVMEADMPQSVLLQDDREMVADVVRTVEFSERVHANVVLVIAAVSLSKRPFHFRLPFPLGKEHLLHHRDQGKRPLGGFGFHHVVSVRTVPFVQYLMPDVDFLLRKVNSRPFQSQHLTSPQSVIGGQRDHQMEFVIGGHAEQFLDLLGIVVYDCNWDALLKILKEKPVITRNEFLCQIGIKDIDAFEAECKECIFSFKEDN